jgi:hypothetical protein
MGNPPGPTYLTSVGPLAGPRVGRGEIQGCSAHTRRQPPDDSGGDQRRVGVGYYTPRIGFAQYSPLEGRRWGADAGEGPRGFRDAGVDLEQRELLGIRRRFVHGCGHLERRLVGEAVSVFQRLDQASDTVLVRTAQEGGA